jgi:TRAP-type C4-dicarboxylate transport system substrate-binding protein
MKTGALDMARINISPLNKSCPETIIPTLPFLFRDIGHMQKSLDGAPGEAILASCLNEGYVGLAFYDSGVRCIYTNNPIRSISDVRGMKLRVPQSDLWIAVANAMGATATPMSIDEIITGQKMGLIDAAENNLLAYESFKHFTVFKSFSQTEHSMAPDVLVFSKKSWDMLSEEDQKIVRQAAKESVPTMRRFWADREGATKKALVAAGCNFVTGVDKGPFQAAMRPVYDRFVTTDKQRSLLKAIQDMS